MTVTVASTDIPNYALQAQIAAVQTLVTASAASNPAQSAAYLAQLTSLQIALINNLMANAFGRSNGSNSALGTPAYILPATVLSSLSVNA